MRNKHLDIVKGLACVLMIFAHSRTLGRTIETSFTDPFWQLGYFAPVLFFASLGISLTYQLKKRTVLSLIAFNILLLLFSFADRARESEQYFTLKNANLIGSLAIATIIALILRKFNSLLMFILFLVLDRVLNHFFLDRTILHGLTFAIIPWVSFIFLGKFMFEKKNWRIYILAIGTLVTFYYYIIKKDTIDSQLPTTLFLGLSVVIYTLALFLAEKIDRIKGFTNLLIFLGGNTLLFYWIHLFILFQTPFVFPAVLMWLYILILSLVSIFILKKVNKMTFGHLSQYTWFWMILISFVFIPMIIELPFKVLFYLLSPVIIIFALNYHNIFKLKFMERLNK